MAMRNPLQQIEGLRREIDRAFEDAGLGVGRAGRMAFLPGRAARQYPLVNIQDTGEGFSIVALAPGLEPDKIDVSLVRNTLTIGGEKIGPQGIDGARWHRMERGAGPFRRTIELPAEVDPDKITATYRDGLLTLELARAASARPRKIAVQTAEADG